LTLQHLLKLRLAAPGGKLPAVVRQDLPGSPPLAYSALYHFQHGLCGLLAEQAMADHVTGMVINHAHQIDRIHPLEMEGKDVDLPQRVGDVFLKTPDLRPPAILLNRRVAHPGIV
jgi:hypothetical protein